MSLHTLYLIVCVLLGLSGWALLAVAIIERDKQFRWAGWLGLAMILCSSIMYRLGDI